MSMYDVSSNINTSIVPTEPLCRGVVEWTSIIKQEMNKNRIFLLFKDLSYQQYRD